MSADSDDADFVFYGTKLQAEEETTSRRHEFQKKDVASAAGSRSLPVWKQVHCCTTRRCNMCRGASHGTQRWWTATCSPVCRISNLRQLRFPASVKQ